MYEVSVYQQTCVFTEIFTLQNNFDIKAQIKQYLQVEVKLLTTPCVIMECEKLGRKLYAVTSK